jgi:site-specific DNA-methyltransferase (adenine-specific)
MTTAHDWLSEAFFDDPEADSLDGGTTNQGPLWHAISPRWGHSMHAMCSYQGMFPARLAHYFIQRYSKPGDRVLDPFSGRGTTTLQARVEGRQTLSNDLSPLGYVLTGAKANPPSWSSINSVVDDLERGFKKRSARNVDVSEDIRMLFHDNTLRQLVYLREQLLRTPITKWSPEQLMLAGGIAGILHGAHRSDGSSMYLSISMPNTFSMAPAYVRKFISEKKLMKIDQNVFERLRDKLARLYLDTADGPGGRVFNRDASRLLSGASIPPESVDLILTSPPYLRVVNYGTSNWIRLWWLGIDEVSRHGGAGRRALDSKLDHRHTYDSYRVFLLRTLQAARRVLRPSGVAVFVIGDVATPRGPSYDLAAHIWKDVGAETGLRLLEFIEDSLASQNKVSRIWGETKGQATDQDCVLVLARDDADAAGAAVPASIDWDEPYKDGGPDEAHVRYRRHRLAS